MLGRLDIRYDKCTGCKACQMACAINKEKQIWPEAARIKVVQIGLGPLDIPVACHQCSDHPCVAACPEKVKALSYDPESGVVLINEEKCLREQGLQCQRCFRACPGEAVSYHPKRGTPLFCDLCGGNPVCVTACGPQALSYNLDPCFESRHLNRNAYEIARELAVKVFGREEIK
ncbi:MAG: 4Fe-4S ferredoxin [Clostridiaceae bacterium BRH_c20a]|nr:MAG: 4Fe-4S ferredoxin [Clostridiaceae bacterium BRH_c20a]